MKRNGFTVSITCGDRPLTEYDVHEDGSGTLNAIVPSKAGEKFKFSCDNSSGTDIRAHCFLDGILADKWTTHAHGSRTFSLVRIDADTVRPMVFSPLQLTEDSDAVACTRSLEKLGMIELRLYRCVDGETRRRRFHPSRRVDGLKHAPIVHEKTKKAGGHTITLGNRVRCAPSLTTTYVTKLDPEEAPYMRFKWRYLPKDLLQAQGIIPLDRPVTQAGVKRQRSPSRSNKPKKRSRKDEPGQSNTLLANLVAQRDALNAQINEAKDHDMPIKREILPIRVATGSARAVIDLTIDDDEAIDLTLDE